MGFFIVVISILEAEPNEDSRSDKVVGVNFRFSFIFSTDRWTDGQKACQRVRAMLDLV